MKKPDPFFMLNGISKDEDFALYRDNKQNVRLGIAMAALWFDDLAAIEALRDKLDAFLALEQMEARDAAMAAGWK